MLVEVIYIETGPGRLRTTHKLAGTEHVRLRKPFQLYPLSIQHNFRLLSEAFNWPPEFSTIGIPIASATDATTMCVSRIVSEVRTFLLYLWSAGVPEERMSGGDRIAAELVRPKR